MASYSGIQTPKKSKPHWFDLRIPVRVFLIAPVVDRATQPLSTRRRKRPVPIGRRWRASTRGCGPVAPRGFAEVAALGIPVPHAGSTRYIRAVFAGIARPARCRYTRTALVVKIALRVPAVRERSAMVAARASDVSNAR